MSCIEGLSCGSHGTNFSTPCFKDETKCSKPTFVSYLCHGTLLHLCDKSDNEKVQQKVCSSIDPKPFQCPEFWEACQQVPGARYHNNECIDSFNAFPNNFDCINRMDVAERLFTLPLAFGEIDRTRTHFRQDNLYGYNQSGFKCLLDNGEQKFFPWNVSEWNKEDVYTTTCALKDGMKVNPSDILKEFFRDYASVLNISHLKHQILELYGRFSQYFDYFIFDIGRSAKDTLLERFTKPCSSRSNDLYCYANSDICYLEEENCDGIAQCPLAEDEDINSCPFPDFATMTCNKTNTNPNFKFLIKATQCDGIVECRNKEDEKNFGREKIIFLILGITALVFYIISYALVASIQKDSSTKIEEDETTFDFNSDSHCQDSLRNFVVSKQGTENQTTINRKLYQFELIQHESNASETLICIKVRILIF